ARIRLPAPAPAEVSTAAVAAIEDGDLADLDLVVGSRLEHERAAGQLVDVQGEGLPAARDVQRIGDPVAVDPHAQLAAGLLPDLVVRAEAHRQHRPVFQRHPQLPRTARLPPDAPALLWIRSPVATPALLRPGKRSDR